MDNQTDNLNHVILSVRRAVLLAGTQAGMNWWPGEVLSPGNQNVLSTLFPGTHSHAGLTVLERSVRRIGAEQRAEGITLFDFTEQHEVVLRQQVDEAALGIDRITQELPLFSSPGELSLWLAEAFQLPHVEGQKWKLNAQHQHATLPDPWEGAPSSSTNVKRLALLVSGLRHSQPGQYLQPVLTESLTGLS